MPRKVNYNIVNDGDYEDYDDYEYDDYDVAYNGGDQNALETSHSEKTSSKVGLWRCTICTYDNVESLPYCDICGVIRDPSAKVFGGGPDKVDGSSGNDGVSAMAKSLFMPLPYGVSKTATLFQKVNDELPLKGAVPFKFDNPSPDDAVSSVKRAPGSTKGNPFLLTSARTSADTPKKGDSRVQAFSETSEHFRKTSIASNILDLNESDTVENSVGKTEIVSSGLQNLNLDKKLDVAKCSTSYRKNVPLSQYKPEKWMMDQEKGMLKQLNLAIIGHVDSGKSTLSGRLLHLLGRISQKEMHKYAKEAKEKGKGSFAYAWAMDESAEERERGVTMTVAVAYFDTKNYRVVLLDSPGHKDFVPNMISGATQADAAILVVDASIGSFEAGMGGNGGGHGQTREHAQLIRSFGVENLIVLVNKLDAVGYSKDRFDLIKKQLGSFLRTCQFKESSISWIPASAVENQNLIRSPSDSHLTSWYKGPCLLDAVDLLPPPEREYSKPLRLPICDVTRSHTLGQVAATGKLESGAIRIGSKVLVMPSGELATIRAIEHDSHACKMARAGDNVSVCLQGIDTTNVISGGVLCHPEYPIAVASSLQLRIFVLDIRMPILVGSQIEFHIHHVKEAARVIKIVSIIDQKSKKESKKAPRLLTAKQSAVIEVALDRAVCVEEFSICRALGRVFLRASGNTIAVGIVDKIIDLEGM